MTPSRKSLPPIAVLVVVVGIVIALRSFFMSNVIEPIALFLWAIWRVAASVNQEIYWTLLILVCAFLAIRFLPPEAQNAPSPHYKYRYSKPNRVEYWRALIANGLRRRDEREALWDRMRDLQRAVAAATRRSEAGKMDEPEAWGEAALPGTLQHLFAPQGAEQQETARPVRMFQHFLAWLKNPGRGDAASISEALRWMESQMEIRDDK